MNTALQLNQEPKLSHWVNPDPVKADIIPAKTQMGIAEDIKPALIPDAETGRMTAVYSFARGDALEVTEPEQLGLEPAKCNPLVLPILGYSYDDNSEIYAITNGPMPKKFRNAETIEGAREVLFCKLPPCIHEIGIRDYKNAFKLRRYEYKPEVTKSGQYVLPFNDLAA